MPTDIEFQCDSWDEYYGDHYEADLVEVGTVPRVSDKILIDGSTVLIDRRYVDGEWHEIDPPKRVVGTYHVEKTRWYCMDGRWSTVPVVELSPVKERYVEHQP